MTEVVGYRLCAKKPVGRSAGQSVVNTAAYISRSKLYDNELGKSFSYEKRHSEVLFSELLTPDISPSFSRIREQLWNNVQWREKHKKAQFARLLEINLPHQLSLDEMKTLIINFVTDNFTALGMIADVNIHKPDIEGDQRNFHAHILLTLRRVNEHGFIGNKAREWNSKELFKQWRENLALACSKSLEIAGYKIESERWKYGHLTLKEQFINALDRDDDDYAETCDHEPTKHKGVDIHQMEKKGIVSYVEEDRKELRAIDENIRQKMLIDIEQDPEILALIAEKIELVDPFLREKFSFIHPELENLDKPIDENLRARLLNRIKNSKNNEKNSNNEHEHGEREREFIIKKTRSKYSTL